MNKKDYKGYELIKAIYDGEIKDYTTIEVHDLSTLDHIKSKIEYSNKRLNWIAGEFDTTCLFDDNIYFRVLEDNTEEIEELDKQKAKNEIWTYTDANINKSNLYCLSLYTEHHIVPKINELVKAVNKLRKENNNGKRRK